MFTAENLKMNRFQNILGMLFLWIVAIQFAYSQKKSITKEDVYFIVEVRVVDDKDNKSIKNADVSINGVSFLYDVIKDFYLVRAKVGDELTVTHPGFETVYYKIRSNEEIRITVEGYDNTYSAESKISKKTKYAISRGKVPFEDNYLQNLDSASYYKEKNIDKSISFITEVLKASRSNDRKASAYKLLGDIYSYWKQYDLAASNYKNAIQYRDDAFTKLLLGQSQFALKEYDLAIKTFLGIHRRGLRMYHSILLSESLGDVYLAKKEYEKAKQQFETTLRIAEREKVTAKVTDLNSKLGDVEAAQGNIALANTKFQNSIDLAKQENPARSILEQDKVADYYNQTQQFDKEIDLRKQTLEEVEKIKDSIDTKVNAKPLYEISTGVSSNFDNYGTEIDTLIKPTKKLDVKRKFPNLTLDQFNSIVNSQAINYKIGRTLVQTDKPQQAIPFLENSIKDAATNNDLVVQKDATRKLSESFASIGDYDKALAAYKSYVSLVDTLYKKRNQEIEQAKRFSLKIAENQNRIASLEKDKALSSNIMDLAIKDQQLAAERSRSQQYVIYSLGVGILAMIVFAILLFRSNRQQKMNNNLLALKSMRSQMNPHFIFNALNSVNSFIAVNDERNANRYLSEFSTLMRSVLENSEEDFIPFTKELELLELYVKLEHNRFQDKFDYRIEIDDSIDLEAFSIPPMLLQPYIENAIWHGLRYKEEKGNLLIQVNAIDDNSLVVMIQDDGVGRKQSKALKTKNQLKQKSKGMSTTKQRVDILNNMYQDRITINVSDLFTDESGTKVELTLKK